MYISITNIFMDYAYLYGDDSGSAITPQDALKNLNVELMSGNGPDVLLLDDMDADIYVREGNAGGFVRYPGRTDRRKRYLKISHPLIKRKTEPSSFPLRLSFL